MTEHTNRIIRTSILTTVATAALALPLLASAASSQENPNASIFNASKQSGQNDSPEYTYAKLQEQTREVCGSSNVRMTGDLKRSSLNEQCYRGTLNSAVLRLDNPQVTTLHQES